MTSAELNDFADAFFKDQNNIFSSKGPEYSSGAGASEDRLANFRRSALAAGTTPLQAWLVFFLKSVDSVCSYVRKGSESEPIRGRYLDIANYAILGAALVSEGEGKVLA